MFMFGSQIPSVSVIDLKQAIDTKRKLFILDVRTPQEFSRGRIAGSVNLPVAQVKENVEQFIHDKDELIYVYCLSGSRSSVAVKNMIKLGYKNVYNVKNGLQAWQERHFALKN